MAVVTQTTQAEAARALDEWERSLQEEAAKEAAGASSPKLAKLRAALCAALDGSPLSTANSRLSVAKPPRSLPPRRLLPTMCAAAASEEVSLPCFSMRMPFAALLIRGHKSLETRKSSMLAPYDGERMLVHAGRLWLDDGGEHAEILKTAGLSAAEIAKATALPLDFPRGASTRSAQAHARTHACTHNRH